MPAIAATSRSRFAYVREATFGTTPATPAMETLRLISSALAGAPVTVASEQLLSDRNFADLAMVGKNIGGELGVEFSIRSFDQLIEAALFGVLAANPEKDNSRVANSITAVAAGTITTTAASPQWRQYMLVQCTGFGVAGNNRVVSAGVASSATSIVITGGQVEASPPSTARCKAIGFEGPSADIVAVLSPTQLTSTLLDFTQFGLAPGQWVKIGSTAAGGAFATAANNGWARILSVAAHTLVFDIVPTGWAADTGTGKLIRVYTGDYVRNGTTLYSHTIEQAHLDNAQYQVFTGMAIDQMSLTAEAQQIVKGGFSFLGANAVPGASGVAGATYTGPWTTDVLTSGPNVGRLAEAGAAIVGPNYVLGLALQIRNNLRAQLALNSAGAVGIGMGRCEVTGRLNTYFGDTTLLAKVLAGTASSFDARFQDNAGNTMVVDIPKLKFATGTIPVPGVDRDVMVDLGFQGLKHPTLGYSVHIQQLEGVGS